VAESASKPRRRVKAATETVANAALAGQASSKPAPSHPNLGLAPVDMTAGNVAAAARIRGNAARISAGALEAAVEADPTIRTRNDDIALRRLLRDGELLLERLALCLASGQNRWLVDYAEWIGPIYRRRGMSLGDLATFCAGIAEPLESILDKADLEASKPALEAAVAMLRRNGRVGGDRHHRNAFLKWMYRGV
jgi:hypothetical protein